MPTDPTALALAGAVTLATVSHHHRDAEYNEARDDMHAAERARTDAAAQAETARAELTQYVRAIIHRHETEPTIEENDAPAYRDRIDYRATFGRAYATTNQSTPGWSAKPKPRNATAGGWTNGPGNDRVSVDLFDSGRGTSDPVKLAAALDEAKAHAIAWARTKTAGAFLTALGIDPATAADARDILTAEPVAVIRWYGSDVYWSAEWHITVAGVKVGDIPTFDLPDDTRQAIDTALGAIERHGSHTADAAAAIAPWTPEALAAWIAKQ